MTKTRHLLLALTNPVAGKEDEFNDWYEAHHVPECIQVPGFKSGQRFKLTASREDSPRQAYLALYELEGEDPQAILDALTTSSDSRTKSDSIDRDSLSLWVFTEMGDLHRADEPS